MARRYVPHSSVPHIEEVDGRTHAGAHARPIVSEPDDDDYPHHGSSIPIHSSPLQPQQQQQQQQQQQYYQAPSSHYQPVGSQSFDRTALMNPFDMGMGGGMFGGSLFGRSPFGGSMFGGNIFAEMEQMMSRVQHSMHQMHSNPGAFDPPGVQSSFSSFSSSSSGGPSGVYRSTTTTTTRGPNGVYETQYTEKSPETGERVTIKRGIGDRARVIVRERDASGREINHDRLENVPDVHREQFDREWQQQAQTNLPRTNFRTLVEQQPTAHRTISYR